MSEAPRRSTRERKRVESIYDSAEKASPKPKSTIRRSRAADEDSDGSAAPALPPGDEEDDASLVSREHEHDDDDTLSSSESSSDETESEAEEQQPPSMSKRKQTPVKPRKQNLAAVVSGTKKSPPRPVGSANGKKTTNNKPAGAARGVAKKRAAATAVVGPILRRQAIAALKSLEKKYIQNPDDETAENSLFVALLSSYSDGESTAAAKKKIKRGATVDENESFYTAGLQKMAQRVMDEHADNSTATEVQLFNLILRSAGGNRDSLLDPKNDLENISDDEFNDLITKVMTDMEDVALDHTPFVANTHKRTTAQIEFRKIFSEFWYRLAQTALTTTDGSAAAHDERVETARDLVAHLLDFVSVGQADVRMAVVMAIYQMSQAMLERTVELQSKLTTAQRQLAVAKRSKQERKKEALEKQVESWNRTVEELESFVDLVVQSVIVKRYRDSSEFIRVLTLKTLTEFGTIRPDMYVTSMYLKYFGWMLSDYNADVRKAAIQGLLVPLEKESADTDSMDDVLKKFLGRLTDMTTDVDLEVQETAMALLLKLLRLDYFDKVEDDSIWNRINVKSLDPEATPTFRRDGLLFVLDQIEEFDDGTATTERKAVEQLTRLSQWLAGVLSDGDIPLDEIKYERADFVVSALRAIPEHSSLATNWSAMLHALKNDKNPRKSLSTDQRLDMVQQRVLLRMFVTAVKLEVSDAGNESAANVDPLLLEAVQDHQKALVTANATSNKTTKQKSKSNSHEELTLALLRSLPELLLRFKSETPVLASLVALPQYFLSNVLNLSRLKKDFESLCANLSSIFLESTDPTTLGNCLFAIVCIAKGDHSRSDEAVVVLSDIANSLRDRLGELLDEHSKIGKRGTHDENDSDNEFETSAEDVASSIHQCIRRMCVLSKRWPLTDLLTGENKDQELESLSESIYAFLVDELRSRIVTSDQSTTQDTAAVLNIPIVWQHADSVHADVAGSIGEGLQLLLVLTAWRLNEEIEKIEAAGEDDSDESVKNHIVTRLRDRIKTVIYLCCEQYVDEGNMDYLAKAIVEFSYAVQSHALNASADLRSLFLKKWRDAESKFLQACALTDDSVLIGASLKFFHQQCKRLRAKQVEGGIDECDEMWDRILLPMGRGLSSNWEVANRREGAAVLALMNGNGATTQDTVQKFSRLFKKLHPARLLEAQMACLRSEFEAWAEAEPDEVGEYPTDKEMEAYEIASKAHRDAFAEIMRLATRFSASLGVGRLKDESMVAALFGFLREGVRFAFSTKNDASTEELPLGCRLLFLNLISKYLSFVRKDKKITVELGNYLNQLEMEMRSHEDYADIYHEDMSALVEFRKLAGLGDIRREAEAASNKQESQSRKLSIRPARNSIGSSVSSIPSKSSKQGSLASIEEEPEGETGASTPSPTKRKNTPSSARTMGSVSSLGTRETRESLTPLGRKETASASSVQSKASARSDYSSEDDDSPKKRRHKKPGPARGSLSSRSKNTAQSSSEDSDDGQRTAPAKRRYTTTSSTMSAASYSDGDKSAPGKRRKVDAESSDESPSVHSKFTEAESNNATLTEDTLASNNPSLSLRSRAESVAHSEALPSVHSASNDDSLMASSDDEN